MSSELREARRRLALAESRIQSAKDLVGNAIDAVDRAGGNIAPLPPPDTDPEPPVEPPVEPPTDDHDWPRGGPDLSDLRALRDMGRTWDLLPFNEEARGIKDGREWRNVRAPIGDRAAFFNYERKEPVTCTWERLRVGEKDEGKADWWALHLFGVDGYIDTVYIEEVGDNEKEGHEFYGHTGPKGFAIRNFYFRSCGGNDQTVNRSEMRFTQGPKEHREKLYEVLDWTGEARHERHNGLYEDCGWHGSRGSFPLQFVKLGQPGFEVDVDVRNVAVRCAWSPDRTKVKQGMEVRSHGGSICWGSQWATAMGVRDFRSVVYDGFDVECELSDREPLVIQNAEEVLVTSNCRFVLHGRDRRIWLDRQHFTGEDKITPSGRITWEGCESQGTWLQVAGDPTHYDPRDRHVFENGKRVPQPLGQGKRLEVK